MLADVTIALIIIGMVATLLVTSLSRQRSAAQRLSDSRNATRLAEDALTRLQARQGPPASTATQTIAIRYLRDPAPQTGSRWAEVTVTIGGRTARLTGTVPSSQDAAPQRATSQRAATQGAAP
jgi:type II secretory pathway pseudopilin PulG